VGRASEIPIQNLKHVTYIPFTLFHLFQTAVSYQLFLNFLMTSKFMVLNKKKNRRRFASVVIQGVTLTLIAIIMVHYF